MISYFVTSQLAPKTHFSGLPNASSGPNFPTNFGSQTSRGAAKIHQASSNDATQLQRSNSAMTQKSSNINPSDLVMCMNPKPKYSHYPGAASTTLNIAPRGSYMLSFMENKWKSTVKYRSKVVMNANANSEMGGRDDESMFHNSNTRNISKLLKFCEENIVSKVNDPMYHLYYG